MKSWMKFGIFWGAFMALVLNVLFPLFDGEPIQTVRVLISLPLWILGGMLFGYVSRKKTPKQER